MERKVDSSFLKTIDATDAWWRIDADLFEAMLDLIELDLAEPFFDDSTLFLFGVDEAFAATGCFATPIDVFTASERDLWSLECSVDLRGMPVDVVFWLFRNRFVAIGLLELMPLSSICFNSMGLGLSSVYELDRISRDGCSWFLWNDIGERDSRPDIGVKYSDKFRLSSNAFTDGDECREKFGDNIFGVVEP